MNTYMYTYMDVCIYEFMYTYGRPRLRILEQRDGTKSFIAFGVHEAV